MNEPTLTCPNCHTSIKLTESLAAPLVESTRKQFEEKLTQKEAEMASREGLLRDKEKELSNAKNKLDEQVTQQVQAQLQKDRRVIAAEEAQKAKLAAENDREQKEKEITDLQDRLKNQNTKLAEAQKAQADFIKKELELEDAKREIDLTIQKRVQEGAESILTQAQREAEESAKFKLMEREQTISAMQKQIEELRRKSEQGSQQLQGEVQELELEALLQGKFIFDKIEPVPKGEFGGDILHHVFTNGGQQCGTILWESKRTKNWSDAWLTKLRADQRAAKAEICVMVSQVLPKNIETFECVDGVWIAHPRVALPIAMLLRQTLLEVATARQSAEGQQTKTEMVYQYLTGPRFRQRVEAIVEAFSSMQEDLDKERKVITKQWAKRQEQIDRVMVGTVGMYGDLQGIAGKSLQEIEGLELQTLTNSDLIEKIS